MRRKASSVSSTEEMRLALMAAAASNAVAKSGEKEIGPAAAAPAAAVAMAAPRNSRRVGVIRKSFYPIAIARGRRSYHNSHFHLCRYDRRASGYQTAQLLAVRQGCTL